MSSTPKANLTGGCALGSQEEKKSCEGECMMMNPLSRKEVRGLLIFLVILRHIPREYQYIGVVLLSMIAILWIIDRIQDRR